MIKLGSYLVEENKIAIEPESGLKHDLINALTPYHLKMQLDNRRGKIALAVVMLAFTILPSADPDVIEGPKVPAPACIGVACY